MATASTPARASSRAEPLDLRLVERLRDRAVGERPLGHVEAQVARHERPRQLEDEVVEVVAALAADLDRVAEALRREQRRARALALDQRVRDERRAVHDAAERPRRRVRAARASRASTRLDRLATGRAGVVSALPTPTTPVARRRGRGR